MSKVKSFCKWKEKEIIKNIDLLASMTQDACYVCKKCARVANTKKALCKAKPLPKIYENIISLRSA